MEILNGTFIQISSEDAEILMEIYDSVFKIGEISKSKDLERCLLFARLELYKLSDANIHKEMANKKQKPSMMACNKACLLQDKM